MTRTERYPELNKRYREEGWGLITGQAMPGVLPENVESQAREVARWAYHEIQALTARANQAGTDAERAEREAAQAQLRVAKLHPQLMGLKSAYRLQTIALKEALLRAARAERDAADVHAHMASVELEFAKVKSRRGDDAIPTELNSRSVSRWLDDNRADDEDE